MTDYNELVKALRETATFEYTGKLLSKRECALENLAMDAAAAIEDLQAMLTEADKKQAYQHDYVCELVAEVEELKAQLPKRGKWVEDTKTYAGHCLSNYKCSLCGKISGTWRRGLEPSELPNWCGNCGADMRKMEDA